MGNKSLLQKNFFQNVRSPSPWMVTIHTFNENELTWWKFIGVNDITHGEKYGSMVYVPTYTRLVERNNLEMRKIT